MIIGIVLIGDPIANTANSQNYVSSTGQPGNGGETSESHGLCIASAALGGTVGPVASVLNFE